MNKTNPNEPAGTCPAVLDPNGQMHYGYDGLTKREHFAAMAMQGMLSNPHYYEEVLLKDLAFMAVCRADDLILELNKEQSHEQI
jgi:hypothetical protein